MKKFIAILLVILACVGITSAIGVVTKGFTDWDMKKINEANSFKVDEYADTLTEERTDDIKITVDENGEITVKGENKTETDIIINVQSMTLKPGTYTLSSGAKDVNAEKYYLCLTGGLTETVYADAEDGESTFSIETEKSVVAQIVIKAGAKIDTTFKPVLVEGKEVGDFYVFG